MQQFIGFVSNNIWLFVALLVILALIVRMEIKRLTRPYKEVPPSEAVRLMNREDAFILDTRESGEIGKTVIVGAKNIPLSSLKQRAGELEKYRGQPVIAYCKSGVRSNMACDLLCKLNFEKVYNLKGGMMAWESEGLPTAKP